MDQNNSAFVTKWRIIGDTLSLPLINSGQYNFDIDWGDGSTSHITSYKARHRYSSVGVYQIYITGLIKGWKATDMPGYKLIDVSQWGCLKLGNKGFYFYNCSELDITATDAPDLSETTNLEYMFGHSNFNGKIGHWDVSRVKCMRDMFFGVSSFNQDISQWDVSNVTDMFGLFHDASSFNQDISSWNVSSVKNMSYIFDGASAFNQPIGKWDVSSVIYMRGMFKRASSFNQDISNWDVSNVTVMDYMFNKASSFNQDISNWNVSRVTDMSSMFNKASSFNQPIGKWNVSRVTSMFIMLEGATAFINGLYLNDLENWNISRPDLLNTLLGINKAFLHSPRRNLMRWDEWIIKHPNKASTEYTCSICITDLPMDDTWRAISCPATMTDGIPHCFHKECIEEWIRITLGDNTCPVCRRKAKAIR
jgi:surface protein